MGLTTLHNKKLIVTKVEQRKKLARLNDDGWKRTRYTEITLATWNVQTMLKPGRMKEIMEEISKAGVDVVLCRKFDGKDEGELIRKIFLCSTVDSKRGRVVMEQNLL